MNALLATVSTKDTLRGPIGLLNASAVTAGIVLLVLALSQLPLTTPSRFRLTGAPLLGACSAWVHGPSPSPSGRHRAPDYWASSPRRRSSPGDSSCSVWASVSSYSCWAQRWRARSSSCLRTHRGRRSVTGAAQPGRRARCHADGLVVGIFSLREPRQPRGRVGPSATVAVTDVGAGTLQVGSVMRQADHSATGAEGCHDAKDRACECAVEPLSAWFQRAADPDDCQNCRRDARPLPTWRTSVAWA